jgi:hypothetical protein
MLFLAVPVFAQWGGQGETRRAEIRGGGGDRGKCTIEVEVDGVAEIEIREDTGRIRTLQGQPATWRRFVCNTAMPRTPYEFSFRGIDGRGRQELLREPGRAGVAVVRIEDPKGGREGYTFDLEWRGSSNWGREGSGGRDWERGRNNWGEGGWQGDWNNDVDFRGRGNGSLRSSGGSDVRLDECRVSISRQGDVDVTFRTDFSGDLSFRGRITRVDRDRVWAEVSGRNVSGSMMIELDARRRVREITMDGRGRERFELRWRE